MMAASTADFPLHRPELLDTLSRGDALLIAAMSDDRRRFRKGDEIIQAEDRVTRLGGLNDLVAFPEAPPVLGHRPDQGRVPPAQRAHKVRSMQRGIACG